jgi:hypothetical protein
VGLAGLTPLKRLPLGFALLVEFKGSPLVKAGLKKDMNCASLLIFYVLCSFIKR